MDRLDLDILASLEREGRQSFAELAQTVGLSKTPCWVRVQALEKSEAIRGYRADVCPRSLGLGVTAFVQIKIDFSRRTEFEQAVIASTAVLECHTTAGDADYILKVFCRDMEDLDNLLRSELSLLPGVQRSTTVPCLKSIKQGGSVVAAARVSR
jgi:Lrp/AsnC family leucine-responsive transcriptional regulator